MKPDLSTFDFIIVNSSAGKDSQAMLDYVYELAAASGVHDRIVVVHADLEDMEWEGTSSLAAKQAAHYNLRFEIIRRSLGNILQHVLQRRMWPSSTARYCTSDHKRAQISKIITRLHRESGKKAIRVLNCMGMRGEESPARAKLNPLYADKRNSTVNREVLIWLPIHSWTVSEVWDRIRESGVAHHPAYDLGMPRLSCCFCIFSPRNALMLAGKHNRALLDRYVEVEKQIGHTFRKDFRIAEIASALDAGEEPGPIQDWRM